MERMNFVGGANHLPGLFLGLGADRTGVDESLLGTMSGRSSVTQRATFSSAKEEVKLDGLTTKHEVEKLIPLDLDIDQLGFDFKKGQSKNGSALMTQCDRLSDGSDLSPEEIASGNPLRRVSLEMA